MTIQVFTVEEGMAIKDNSGTTVFDVTNAGNMTVDGTSALQGATTFGSGGTTFTLPTADGSANQALITDGSGNVTWADPGAQYNFIISDGVTTQTIDDGETVLFTAGTVTYFYINNNNDNYEYWKAMQSGEALQMDDEDDGDYEDDEEEE